MSQRPQDMAAVLGLGIVGSRAYERLRAAGRGAACWNRTPKGLPGEASDPATAVRGAAIVSIYLKDAPAVREVMEAAAAGLGEGTVVLNHSTVDLATTRWLHAWCEERGCRFLDAPFTGSKVAAGAGELVYYLGGGTALIAELDGFLKLTSRATLVCGEVGSATVIKLATNLISACTVQALAESLALTTSHGVDAGCLMRAVSENVSGSKLSEMKLPAMAAAEFDTHFSLSNMAKDTRYMLALAEEASLETPAVAAVAKRLTDLDAAGLGGLDFSALAKPYVDPS